MILQQPVAVLWLPDDIHFVILQQVVGVLKKRDYTLSSFLHQVDGVFFIERICISFLSITLLYIVIPSVCLSPPR